MTNKRKKKSFLASHLSLITAVHDFFCEFQVCAKYIFYFNKFHIMYIFFILKYYFYLGKKYVWSFTYRLQCMFLAEIFTNMTT